MRAAVACGHTTESFFRELIAIESPRFLMFFFFFWKFTIRDFWRIRPCQPYNMKECTKSLMAIIHTMIYKTCGLVLHLGLWVFLEVIWILRKTCSRDLLSPVTPTYYVYTHTCIPPLNTSTWYFSNLNKFEFSLRFCQSRSLSYIIQYNRSVRNDLLFHHYR